MSEESGNGLVGRDWFISKDKRRFDEFEIDGVGTIRIRSLTERERSEYESELLSNKGGFLKHKLTSARRRLIALTVVDASGNLLLNKPGDVKDLEEKDGKIMEAIYERAAIHCGIKDSDIENLVKNSEGVLVV